MTIPASKIVSVTPGVVSSGGTALALNALFFTKNALMPSGTIETFANAAAVKTFFGASSDEYAAALIYFAGYTNSTTTPGAMLFAYYCDTARGAYLRSASLASLRLTALKALTGTLIVTVGGTVLTANSLNFSSATSFSDAAATIATALGASVAVTWNAVTSTFQITSVATGSAASITYASGTLADTLKLSQAQGALISVGDDVDTPAGALAAVVAINQNWASFVTLWEPVLADKQAFAAWVSAQKSRFVYVAWDTDANAITNGATSTFGNAIKTNQYDGVIAIGGDPAQGSPKFVAYFIAGLIASIDFNRPNSRLTAAFKQQSGLAPTVVTDGYDDNLIANGYSYYGSFATAAESFVFFYDGAMPGSKFGWLDSYVNQIYMNSQFQSALMTLLTTLNSIPYTQRGYGQIRAAMQDVINSAVSFGAIRAGVTLSAAEASAINSAAGVDTAAANVHTQGYYLQILDPGADARAARKTPVINFWYTDGGAVQKISLASIDVL